MPQLKKFLSKYETGLISNIDDKLLGQTRRHEGFVGSTTWRSAGPRPKMAMTAGSTWLGTTPS